MNNISNLHNRKSIRLSGFDYSRQGFYFVTLCVYDKQPLFGEITNGIMNLNEAGNAANQCWLDIPKHYSNAIIHEYVIMPDHVHGIIELINKDEMGGGHFEPIQANQFQHIIPHSIGAIVRGFKIGVTKWFRETMPNRFTKKRPIWQRNFYESIIRDEESFEKISNYILNNPSNYGRYSTYSNGRG